MEGRGDDAEAGVVASDLWRLGDAHDGGAWRGVNGYHEAERARLQDGCRHGHRHEALRALQAAPPAMIRLDNQQ